MSTWWDGVPCRAARVLVRVEDPGRRGLWYDELIGQERRAVIVEAPATGTHRWGGQMIVIDDEGGWGWRKVTAMRGHRGVTSGRYFEATVLDVFEDPGGLLR